MPTNLPAEAQLAWQKYLEAKTLSEKIKALEQFISLVPKHKGTEKLLMQAKKTLTKLKLEASRRKELRKGSGIHPAFSIPKEEDAQIVLFGLPGTGKTALFNYLTENNIPYGKPTLLPNVGVLKYKGAVFQIIDLPPIFSDNIDSTPNGRSILSLVRNCDLVLLVTDLSQDIEWQLSTLMRVLKTARIIIDRDPPPIKFMKLSKGGIQIYGANNTPFNLDELKDFINSLGILNCILEIYGPVDEEDILNALDRRTVYKKAIIVATKADIPNVEMNIEMLKQLAGKLPIVFTSALAKKGKEKLGDTIFSSLGLIRVWTKKDGKISERALVLPKGATVKDAAEKIHSDFVKKFKYAIVEREGGKVKRFRVGLNFTLEDNDVLSIYTTE
ncbi:MAG: hypothetical protein DRZ80_08365 [Thermoprotei archaeon]|nr:MAG: hypothetical protein DRZ80_08365 [Thermoprotei archaeon]